MPTDSPTSSHPGHAGHAASGRPLVLTLLALLALTAISWGISHAPLGHAAIPVALAIAVVKAGLVATWFMELPMASTPARVVMLVTILFIALLCAGTIGDLGMR